MDAVFLSLAALACPVAMGLMMWFMGRGMRATPEESGAPPSLEHLRAEHRRLGGEIERLQGDRHMSETHS